VFAWSEERPDSASVPIDVYFKERDEDCNINGYVAVGLGIGIHKFEEEHQPYPSDYDIVTLNVSATANARYGLSYDYNWISFWWIPENELAYKNVFSGVGDELSCWVDFPYPFWFRFYGGLGSAEYDKVYVHSNGFVTFMDPPSSTCPPPSYFPSAIGPNTVIAAVWSDLEVDGAASIITGLWEFLGRRHALFPSLLGS
jgi:hypothetical protein